MTLNNENSRVGSSIASASKVVSLAVPSSIIQNKAFAFALFANALWGTSFLASKYTLQIWGPFTASALRFTLALIFMAIFFPMVGTKINRLRSIKDVIAVFMIGLTGFGALYPLQLAGLQTISSSSSAALMLTSPVLVILLGRIFLAESLSAKKAIALLLGITGGLLLLSSRLNFSPGINISQGQLLTFGASFSLAASVIATRKFANHLSAGTLTFWSMLVGLIVMVPFALYEPPKSYEPQNFLLGAIALLYLALICSAFCFFLWNAALALAPAKNIASSMHIKTPMAVLIGVLLARERLSAPVLIGSLIVGMGVWLSQMPENSKMLELFRNFFRRLRMNFMNFKIENFRIFNPELIVEATSVCDRMCPGCYAPNVISIEDAANLYKTNPKLFLDPIKLESQLNLLKSVESIAIRGGEPSRHPGLPFLIEICARHSKEVYLETHGRWILPELENEETYELLLRTCHHLGVTIKLSFDKMHGLSADQLFSITERLDSFSIPWVVAITEKNEIDFFLIRKKCFWVENFQIIFQKMASSASNLFKPYIGVVHADGTFTSALRTKHTFERSPRSFQSEASEI
jgi:drug/metabolite transporter (DMT)-like permease